ncbi:hypothetical protein [Chitinimonas sp. BJB300]|uniref:hypothetical protein n=1 Tax=Chitinimonas sp. BJB300 TaxID=1559339 RepID=UPI000C0D2A1D|nr:hypothetical protein [Chitinimonas sp. BJB300]PHV09752.1 hypothetical protein CSQ89_19950 [Chitinimonas sp. BJB300]TSJ90143.1 hypothetical protein FG002_008180 [Chitinimonas sp. BJB300]
MLPIKGYLRDSVSIHWLPASVELAYSVWSIELPLRHLSPSKKLSAFLRREIPSSDLVGEQEQVQNLIYILSYQGCLISEKIKQHYSLQEIKSLYVSFCNEFYGRYYAHPVWGDMRAETIPNSIILQWISRTYFLSRFAGVTASAASLNGPTVEVQTAFLKSAVEEYSHCEDYYLPPPALYPAEQGYTAGIAPSASFIAFDQQMLHIAQHDWLAHLFVALIQERTAHFKDGANHLYSRVEHQLDMPGLFDGWRTHISFDEDHAHADDLETLFEQKLPMPVEQLQKSFDEANLALELLSDGLDDVLNLGEMGINPRAVVDTPTLRPQHVRGIRCLTGVHEYTVNATSINALTIEIVELIANSRAGANFLDHAAAFLLNKIEPCLAQLVAACVKHCDQHAEIIYLGNVLAAVAKTNLRQTLAIIPMEKSGRIIQNFLSHHTKNPTQFAFTLLTIMRIIEAGLKISNQSSNISRIHSVTKMLETAVIKLGRNDAIIPRINEALFIITFLEFAYDKKALGSPAFKIAMRYTGYGTKQTSH